MKESKFIEVAGIRTHYFEAGISNPIKIILLHSAEYGGAAEFSWEHNFDALATSFHVIAPDHLGFGWTDKLFDFENHSERRIRHIKAFLEAKDIKRAAFVGSSMSGTLALSVAARPSPDWPISAVVACSGGGEFPNNEARDILSSYDGSKEHMRKIIGAMFHDPSWSNDEIYLERRHAMSLRPGAWESASAARFKAPFRAQAALRERENLSKISVPTLIMAGRWDKLRHAGYEIPLVNSIPRAELHVFENAGHMGNIECPDEFNGTVLRFLKSNIR